MPGNIDVGDRKMHVLVASPIGRIPFSTDHFHVFDAEYQFAGQLVDLDGLRQIAFDKEIFASVLVHFRFKDSMLVLFQPLLL